MLLCIPFFKLQLQGIEGGKLLAVANHLSDLQKKNDSSLRNVYQVKNLLHTMHSLASNNDLTPDQKRHGFNKIFFKNKYVEDLIIDEQQILMHVIATKGLLQLKDPQWPVAAEDFSLLFRSSLEKVIPMQQCKGDIISKI